MIYQICGVQLIDVCKGNIFSEIFWELSDFEE